MDPLFVTKGAKVRMVRGSRVDSSNGPIEAGPSRVQDKAPNGSLLSDGDGNPVLVDNPKPPPEGVIFGPADPHGRAPVKFPSGAWAIVEAQDLELIEAAQEDKDADPVLRRAAEVASAHAKIDGAADAIEGLRQRFEEIMGGLVARIGRLEELAPDGAPAAMLQRRTGELENAADVLAQRIAQLGADVSGLLADKAQRDDRAKQATDPQRRFVTAKELADAVAAVTAQASPTTPPVSDAVAAVTAQASPTTPPVSDVAPPKA